MVTFVIGIIKRIRLTKCKIHNFFKKFVRNKKLGVYYLFLFTFRAKMSQEVFFALVKVSYKGDFLKVYNKQRAKKICLHLTRLLYRGTSHLKVLHQKDGLFAT